MEVLNSEHLHSLLTAAMAAQNSNNKSNNNTNSENNNIRSEDFHFQHQQEHSQQSTEQEYQQQQLQLQGHQVQQQFDREISLEEVGSCLFTYTLCVTERLS